MASLLTSSSVGGGADDAEERQLLMSRLGSGRGGSIISTEAVSSPTSSGFVSGSLDDDEERQVGVTAGGNAATDDDPHDPDAARRRLRYEMLCRRAQEEDLSSVQDTSCIYLAGTDGQGRQVVVFIGKWFKPGQVDLEKALLYLIRLVGPAAESGEYVVVYFHTRTSRDNTPHYWWMKEVYNTLTYAYKKNLKAFYVVHPTMWAKLTCWWFSTFMAPAIKNKIHYVRALEELKASMDPKALSIPMFIEEQDMTFNGLRYYQP